jgi:hypothetical protein
MLLVKDNLSESRIFPEKLRKNAKSMFPGAAAMNDNL